MMLKQTKYVAKSKKSNGFGRVKQVTTTVDTNVKNGEVYIKIYIFAW